MTVSVLIVDDDVEMARMLDEGLRRKGYSSRYVLSADEAFERVMAGDVDVLVTDLRMRGMNGLELCERVVSSRPDVPVIVMTGFGSMESAVATIRAGAFDFLTKPLDADALVLPLERAASQRSLRAEVKRLRLEASELPAGRLTGESTPMRDVRNLIARAAPSDATVLITGESGTGKELVAGAIHEQSKRSSGPFVAINCSALPENLLESELFGFERGAFTDAKEKRVGLFAQAHGGTLFLDEVGEMPLTMQAKLLRALESRTVRPLGGAKEVAFDTRIVAATNRDLAAAVDEQRFREDLLYRLNVIQIELPPLRARGNDVLVLAQQFLSRHARRTERAISGLSSAVAEKLLEYAWPGNVRELQNCIERAVALSTYEEITVHDLPEKIRDYKPSHVIVAASDPEELVSMEEVERRYALRVLESVGGNKNQAARILGWDRKTLYRRLDQWQRGSK